MVDYEWSIEQTIDILRKLKTKSEEKSDDFSRGYATAMEFALEMLDMIKKV